MSYDPETPFENLESALEYVELLVEAIEEARRDVNADIAAAAASRAERRREALQLVSWKLNKLSDHLSGSRRILNDLRTLRRLLLQERLLEDEALAGKSIAASSGEV